MSRPLEPPHAKLAKRAAQWLRRNHEIVITEISGGSETPDAIGFRGNSTTLIECKASRSDFLADKRKFLGNSLDQAWGIIDITLRQKG